MNQTASSAAVRYDPPPPATIAMKSGRPQRNLSLNQPTPPPPPAAPYASITSVSSTIVDPGSPVETVIQGVNLQGVTGVYFDGTTPNGQSGISSYPNPRRIVPTFVSPNGDVVKFVAPSNCTWGGPLLLEQNWAPYNPTPNVSSDFIPANPQQSAQFMLRCLGKPTLTGALSVGRPGGSMTLSGTNLVGVTAVTDLAHGGSAMTYNVPNANTITISIPNYNAQQNPQGFVMVQPNVVAHGVSVSYGPMQIFLPPMVTSATGPLLSPGQVAMAEAGGLAMLSGYGFGTNPTVSINGQQVSLQAGSNNTTLYVQVPPFAASASYIVTTTMGLSTGGGIMLMNPTSSIDAVIPTAAPVGGRITVTGVNLFRARGICFTPGPALQGNVQEVLQLFTVGMQAPAWQQWTNSSVTLDVPANAGSGRIGIWTAPTQVGPHCEWSGTTLTVQ